MPYRLDVRKPSLVCLILLISFPSFATVLVSPALPAISDYFQITDGYAQQLITIFIAGYAIGQLVYSPFANRYGRKTAIYVGIGLYFISCFVCLAGIFLKSFEMIFLGRFLMALGCSVGMIITFTIINDYYFPEQSRPIVSFTALAYAFMPAIAIALGGFFTSHISWIAIFYFYLIYGVLILVSSMRLPETLIKKNYQALNIKILLKNYAHAFANRRLIIFGLIYGLMGAFIYIIASEAPFIGIDTIGLTSATYGLLLLFPYAGQFIGSFVSGKISKYYSTYQVMSMGFVAIIFGCIFILSCFLLHWVNIFSLFAPLFFIMLGIPMVFSGAAVLALVEYEDKATGSAIMTFVTMMVPFMAVYTLTKMPEKNPLVMPLLFIFIVFIATIIYSLASNRFSRKRECIR